MDLKLKKSKKLLIFSTFFRKKTIEKKVPGIPNFPNPLNRFLENLITNQIQQTESLYLVCSLRFLFLEITVWRPFWIRFHGNRQEIGANLVLICIYVGRQHEYAISFTLKSLTKFFFREWCLALKVYYSGQLLSNRSFALIKGIRKSRNQDSVPYPLHII